ncbi:GSCOCT00014265001.2-RA-CDS [Cotesia congregata]|uniref:Cc_bv8.3_28.6 n=2 Tax=root TaxID=1 RepID=S6D4S5_COTCN|nr:GSCOCT00014265001.2-RA-CDS [Cotesia congregata]CAG5092470.1 cc_bv8.3_28.6 [Cotesia congregata]CCB96404.1 hypothetical protein BV8-3 [Bracoviriform congregatae]CCQ71208.1 hypothetical protein BV8-3 [Cotesia congregata]
MEEVYAKIAFVELAPDILVPYEWPVSRVYDVVLSTAKEVIMQNTQEDPVLQVDGIPARLYRYVRKHRFYHVFKKIPRENVYGCYVYDIALSEYQNKDYMKYSSGTNSCDDSKSRRTCSYPEDYTISYYYVPHRSYV